MGLESSVGLIVATLDLQLVRLLRGAMRGEDGDGFGPGARRLIHPGPGIEARKRITPESVIEPRPRIHPQPKFEPRPVLRAEHVPPAVACPTCDGPASAEKSSAPSSPVQPPWRVLPWDQRYPRTPRVVVRKIKVSVARPDIVCKGSLIDLFI